jgi:hypothetical protein
MKKERRRGEWERRAGRGRKRESTISLALSVWS